MDNTITKAIVAGNHLKCDMGENKIFQVTDITQNSRYNKYLSCTNKE